jgi:hypothetical protein
MEAIEHSLDRVATAPGSDFVYAKNGKRYLRQAESSAIRFLIIAEAFKRMAASHVHTRLPVLYPED